MRPPHFVRDKLFFLCTIWHPNQRSTQNEKTRLAPPVVALKNISTCDYVPYQIQNTKRRVAGEISFGEIVQETDTSTRTRSLRSVRTHTSASPHGRVPFPNFENVKHSIKIGGYTHTLLMLPIRIIKSFCVIIKNEPSSQSIWIRNASETT